jgi:signal transduction histidine kinase
LNAIIGMIGLLKLTGNLSTQSEFMVDRAEENAHRLLNLISDILDISRIEAGRMELVPEELTVRDFFESVRAQIGVLAEKKKLAFNINIDDDVAQIIHADQDAILKILTNLLGNAIKFTDAGEVTLNVHSNTSHLLLEVEDTGPGIPRHLQPFIFDRFRQVDSSSRREHGGTGLGLAIVSELCALMNGKVQLDSEPGNGSKFTVSLPVIPQPQISL